MNDLVVGIVFVVTCIGLALELALCLVLRRMIMDVNEKIDAIGLALEQKKQRDDALAKNFDGLTAAFYRLVDRLAVALGVPLDTQAPAAVVHPAPKSIAKK